MVTTRQQHPPSKILKRIIATSLSHLRFCYKNSLLLQIQLTYKNGLLSLLSNFCHKKKKLSKDPEILPP